MNLIFRLLWMWIAAHFGRRCEMAGENHITFRCMPWDLDLNMHMTNSRYHSFLDLCRVDFMIRSGAWARLRKEGLGPVLGSSTIRFRRPIKPLQKFDVTARMLTWDERWIYMEQRILAGGDVASIAVMKVTFVGKQGRVPTEKLMAIMGYTGPKPAAPELTARQNSLDELLKA